MSRHRAVSVAGAFAVAAPLTVLPGLLWAAAWASDSPQVTPSSVVPGHHVRVSGDCPADPGAPFVAATLGIERLGRYAVVPVADGHFHGKVAVSAVGSADAPEVGSTLRLRVSCRTAAAFVVPAGSVALHVVGTPPAKGTSDGAGAASGKAAAKTAGAASAGSDDRPVPLGVPLAAFAVTVIASLGAYVLGVRSRRRDHAMSRHPASGGVGRTSARGRA